MYAARSRAHLDQRRQEHLHFVRASHDHRKRHRAHNLFTASSTSCHRRGRSVAPPRRAPGLRQSLQEVVQSLSFARVFPLRLCYLFRAASSSFFEGEIVTNGTDAPRTSSHRLANIFTDVQFWVPVAVLLAGLLLLEWIR